MRKKAAESASRRLFYPSSARLNCRAHTRSRGSARRPARKGGHTRYCFRHCYPFRTCRTRLTHTMRRPRPNFYRNSYFPTIRRSRRYGIRKHIRRYRPLPPHNSCATASRNCGRSRARVPRFPHRNDVPVGSPPDRLRPYSNNGYNRCYNNCNSRNNPSGRTRRYRKTKKENPNNTYTTSSFVELQKAPPVRDGTYLLLHTMQTPRRLCGDPEDGFSPFFGHGCCLFAFR